MENAAPKRKRKGGKPETPVSIWELEQQSTAGMEVANAVGKFSKTPPDFWVHRTVLLLTVKITEHLLRVRRIVPRQMLDLMKSLTTTLLADVNRHRIQQANGKARPVLATEQEVQKFTDDLDWAVRRIYGLKLKKNTSTAGTVEALPSSPQVGNRNLPSSPETG